MADFLKNVFGGGKASEPAVKLKADPDFADFAGAPDPVAEPVPAATIGGPGAAATSRPYTKWYNVHERHSLSEFKAEGVILAISALIFLFHIIGARANRSKARSWIRANASILRKEFALVGFGAVPTMDNEHIKPDSLLKEKSLFEFATYASGRQNTAFVDVKLTLTKKFNPIMNLAETAASFFSDVFTAPGDVMEAFLYPFDGKESLTIPSLPGSEEARAKDAKSNYDGFVWALVNKESMKRLREDRYDVTLTATKESPKLPNWLTVMSESAEVTDTLLTQDLIDAVVAAGDKFEYLIVSDQPVDKPVKLDDAAPRKRIFLKYRLPSDNNYDNLLPIFSHFLRLPDFLVQNGRFRPEVLKKVRATREAMISQIKKAAEEEKSEERQFEKEKAKKAKRDAELKGLDAKAQKKYLEKEKEKELRRSQKKMTMRG
ncbi:hypothetical protein H634G_07302 [Metarhizium anisopliae BRIP 53293]|uniref:Uncharacterized protein n=1 Tax=Metarhizium anisopliae BRIP 53293 TaxID=1291518 RepID=A0A0D9NUV5_METAN|nr:hypothetical protein H634G_07302 [Metarhizium anisopliae BRIP 53293]KJK90418.1 hypothetical protein H633G_05714 [Metarhizium anisopliae BRIP 53284]